MHASGLGRWNRLVWRMCAHTQHRGRLMWSWTQALVLSLRAVRFSRQAKYQTYKQRVTIDENILFRRQKFRMSRNENMCVVVCMFRIHFSFCHHQVALTAHAFTSLILCLLVDPVSASGSTLPSWRLSFSRHRCCASFASNSWNPTKRSITL